MFWLVRTEKDPQETVEAEPEATEEPVVLTPEEEAERALHALSRGAVLNEMGEDPARLSDPHSPLRMPGESSPRRRGDQRG